MTTPPDGLALNLQVAAGLSASLDTLSQELAAQRNRSVALAQAIHPFSVPPNTITLSSGAGTLNQPNLYSPQMSNYWDIRRISCTGFTQGTVTVYLGQSGADILAIFSTAGVLLNGKAQILLGSNDALYFSAASITGSVTVAISGIEIAARCIGDYLS